MEVKTFLYQSIKMIYLGTEKTLHKKYVNTFPLYIRTDNLMKYSCFTTTARVFLSISSMICGSVGINLTSIFSPYYGLAYQVRYV